MENKKKLIQKSILFFLFLFFFIIHNSSLLFSDNIDSFFFKAGKKKKVVDLNAPPSSFDMSGSSSGSIGIKTDCSGLKYSLDISNFLSDFINQAKNSANGMAKILLINTGIHTMAYMLAVKQCAGIMKKGINPELVNSLNSGLLASVFDSIKNLFTTSKGKLKSHKIHVKEKTKKVSTGFKQIADVKKTEEQVNKSSEAYKQCVREQTKYYENLIINLVNWRISYNFSRSAEIRTKCLINNTQREYNLADVFSKYNQDFLKEANIKDPYEGKPGNINGGQNLLLENGILISGNGEIKQVARRSNLLSLNKDKDIFEYSVLKWYDYVKINEIDPILVLIMINLINDILGDYEKYLEKGIVNVIVDSYCDLIGNYLLFLKSFLSKNKYLLLNFSQENIISFYNNLKNNFIPNLNDLLLSFDIKRKIKIETIYYYISMVIQTYNGFKNFLSEANFLVSQINFTNEQLPTEQLLILYSYFKNLFNILGSSKIFINNDVFLYQNVGFPIYKLMVENYLNIKLLKETEKLNNAKFEPKISTKIINYIREGAIDAVDLQMKMEYDAKIGLIKTQCFLH